MELTLEDLEHLIKQWHGDRNLIAGSTDKDQYMKLIQEAGELSDNICKGNDIKDDIGDMIVVLINIAARNNLSLNDCMTVAYNDIKDRTGTMIDGVFVKEGDNEGILGVLKNMVGDDNTAYARKYIPMKMAGLKSDLQGDE